MGGGGGVMVVASMYPASRIVVIPINCEYTSILDNMLLLRTLRYKTVLEQSGLELQSLLKRLLKI